MAAKTEFYEIRDAAVIESAKRGKSYGQVGKDFGITRQRVSQICKNHGLVKIMPVPMAAAEAAAAAVRDKT